MPVAPTSTTKPVLTPWREGQRIRLKSVERELEEEAGYNELILQENKRSKLR